MTDDEKKATATVSVTMRLPATLVELVDRRVAELHTSRDPGLTRTDVIRELIVAGLRVEGRPS